MARGAKSSSASRSKRPRVEGLLDFIPKLSPEFRRPDHMVALENAAFDARDTLRGERARPLRLLLSYPIRHFKTETLLHMVVWLLCQEPWMRIIVVAHDSERANYLGKRLRELAERTDYGPDRGWEKLTFWRNSHGGGATIMSAAQSKTSEDCHLLLCDDPIDENGSRDPETREIVDRVLRFYATRCRKSDGTPGPVIIVMSRTHPDDPIGMRLHRKAEPWTYLHQPAIIDLGKPTERMFAPSVLSLEEMRRTRAEEAEADPAEEVFWSRFQGVPPVLASSRFDEPKLYDSEPEVYPGSRVTVGVALDDEESWACVARVRLAHDGIIYVQSLERVRSNPDLIVAALGRQPSNRYVYVTARDSDAAILRMLERDQLGVQPLRSAAPLTWRARRVIERWNNGALRLPRATWVRSTASRLRQWDGTDGTPADLCALVAAVESVLDYEEGAPELMGRWAV